MAFISLTFIAFFLVVVLLTCALPSAGGRSGVLLAANTVFIASFVDEVIQVVPLAGFLIMSYAIVEALRRTRSPTGLWIGLAAVIGSFVILKRFSFLGPALLLPFPYLIIGLSYVLFRVLHLMIDAKQGEFREPIPPLQFFNYTCNFLSFIAGPIQRYPEYASQQRQVLTLDEEKVFRAFARLIRGFLKVGVVSAAFKYLFDTVSGRLLDPALAPSLPVLGGLVGIAAMFYTVYLYANFAGYMDIVIGIGRLMGHDLPENFNQPFLARNFLDFWSRWHMTLSDWFKTYVFNPLLTLLATRFTAPQAGPYLGVAAFFVTFLIMGIWHGTTVVFVIYGLLMGAGASVNKLWQVVMTRRLGKKRYKAAAEKTLSIYLSRGMTFAYFALALGCLWLEMPQLLMLTDQLGVFGVLACYVTLAVAAGMAFFIWDGLVSQVAALRVRAKSASEGVITRNVILAFQILLIVAVTSFFHKAPEFVYRAF